MMVDSFLSGLETIKPKWEKTETWKWNKTENCIYSVNLHMNVFSWGL